MKISVIYTEQFEIDLDTTDIAQALLDDLDDGETDVSTVADERIKKAISEYADVQITEREWPSYRLDEIDELVPEVRKKLIKLAVES